MFIREDNQLPDVNGGEVTQTEGTLESVEIKPEKVQKLLEDLKEDRILGPNNIHPIVLKGVAIVLASL